MISVIIPSLFRINRFFETLHELSQCPDVGEIILIDNSGFYKELNIPKLVYVFEKENIFINPAWNKGVSLAKYDKLCIMNDDIWFDFKYLKNISEFITPEAGLLGMAESNYGNVEPVFEVCPVTIEEGFPKGRMNYGFACCFFVHKDNWLTIPESMKLWCGDDYLFYHNNNLTNYIIKGLKCEGQISGTLDSPSLLDYFYPLKMNDLSEIHKYIQNGTVLKRL